MKECGKCEKTKEFSEFHKDKSKPDGHHAYCKECRKIETLEHYRFKNPKKANYCIDCGIDISDMHANCIRCNGCKFIENRTRKKLEARKEDKMVKNLRNVAWRKRNPERYKELMSKHNKNRNQKKEIK